MQRGRGNQRNSTPGFIPSRNLAKPVDAIDNIPELLALLEKTKGLLTTCSATLRPQLELRRTHCEARLIHLLGMRSVETELEHVHISQEFANESKDVTMADATSDEPSTSSTTIVTKLRILAKPVPRRQQTHKSTVHSTAPLDHREAMRLQQEESERMNARRAAAHASRTAKEERVMAGIPSGWHNLTQQEKNARIMAFMSFRPSESDEEYDEEDDDDLNDEDMESLLREDYEDGIKGQDILDPDELADLIQVQAGPDLEQNPP